MHNNTNCPACKTPSIIFATIMDESKYKCCLCNMAFDDRGIANLNYEQATNNWRNERQRFSWGLSDKE